MPSFNSALFVVSSFESLLLQIGRSWELIVCDDASTDDTFQVVSGFKSLVEKESVTVLHGSVNQGPAIARNKALELATGRFIAFLDADDLWYPDKLEKQIRFMLDNKVAFCYSGYDKIDEQGNVLGYMGVPEKVSYRDLLKSNCIGCLTVVYDTEYFGKVKMPEIRKRQDFALWLQLLKKVDYAYGINEPLAQYRVHSSSISANKLSAAAYTWKVYREVEKLPLLPSLYYFSHYALRGVLRKYAPALARRLGVLHS